MTQAHKTPGALVLIHDKCFKRPYEPYYNYLKNIVLEVIKLENKEHVLLKPVFSFDNNIELKKISKLTPTTSNQSTEEIIVHTDEIKSISLNLMLKIKKHIKLNSKKNII